jgi:predicted signal transduction protein with EAL and GGDEF domain
VAALIAAAVCVDILKLDKSFVEELVEPRGDVLAGAILQLGRGLGLTTVAGGWRPPPRRNGCAAREREQRLDALIAAARRGHDRPVVAAPAGVSSPAPAPPGPPRA